MSVFEEHNEIGNQKFLSGNIYSDEKLQEEEQKEQERYKIQQIILGNLQPMYLKPISPNTNTGTELNQEEFMEQFPNISPIDLPFIK